MPTLEEMLASNAVPAPGYGAFQRTTPGNVGPAVGLGPDPRMLQLTQGPGEPQPLPQFGPGVGVRKNQYGQDEFGVMTSQGFVPIAGNPGTPAFEQAKAEAQGADMIANQPPTARQMAEQAAADKRAESQARRLETAYSIFDKTGKWPTGIAPMPPELGQQPAATTAGPAPQGTAPTQQAQPTSMQVPGAGVVQAPNLGARPSHIPPASWRKIQEDAIAAKYKEQAKAATANDQKAQGKSVLSVALSDAADAYGGLEAGGNYVSPDKSWWSNVAQGVAASGLGQAISRYAGTTAQSFRDDINSIRPIIIQGIRQATQMSARAMDSDKELQFYIAAATDPTMNINTNWGAIARLDRMYGSGEVANRIAKTHPGAEARVRAAALRAKNLPQPTQKQGWGIEKISNG